MTQQDNVTLPKAATPEQLKEEKNWERALVRELMGIHTVSSGSPTYPADCDHTNIDGLQQEDSLSTMPLCYRTKTHLLMKAPAGHIFTGMFPQQQIILHEDYPSPSALVADKTRGEELSITPNCRSLGSRGVRDNRKPARWPIQHLHLLGPSAVALEQRSDYTSNSDSIEDDDEMWYLIGPSIPILSPLL
jgi:hypothetical protein